MNPAEFRADASSPEDLQGHILVVDDLPDNVRLLASLLSQEGYRVQTANSGAVALKAAFEHPPDLIMLDIRMPQMDGYQVCQRLKVDDRTREVPVIFLSALSDVTDKIKAFELGGADYITKPFHVDEVLARVETHLHLKQLQERMRSQNLRLKHEIADREQALRERERAETALRDQAERERVIREMTQRIHQSLDLDAILNTAVFEVRQFLQTDRVLVYRLLAQTGSEPIGVVVVESVKEAKLSLLGQPIDPLWFQHDWDAYRWAQSGPSTDILDRSAPSQHPPHSLLQSSSASQPQTSQPQTSQPQTSQPPSLPQALQVQASLVVPIFQNELLWGLLIAHHCEVARDWQQADVEFLSQLANQAAIAIQQSELVQQIQQLNADLETQVKRRTAELEQAFEFEATLKRITDKVRDSLDEDQIMQQAVQELAIALGAVSCNAALYDFEQGTSTIHYEYTTLPQSSIGRVARLGDYPEIYSQILKGVPSQFCSIVAHPVRGHVAMLAYPILDDQGVLGDLWLVNPKDCSSNEQDIRLVQQVSNQCAIALRQSRLYQEAQAQVKELERLNHLKDDFLSTVSHELRTPMSNIKMAAQMLEITLKRNGQLEEASPADRYVKILRNECEREISLINDLLDLSRLESETEPLALSELRLQTWVPKIVEPFFDKAQNQQLRLEVNVPPTLPLMLTDSIALGRILSELLLNACKYTPPGEEIRVVAQERDDRIELSVANTGVEIRSQESERIFDKFYRIPNGDPWKHGGTGLGLALVRRLLERLGSSIHVESGNGRTVFTARFPKATHQE